MQKRNKKILAGALAALGVAAAGGVAWAVFSTTADGTATGGAAEEFTSITVTGQQVGGALLPGEAGDVTLHLVNPNDNVNALVTEVTAGDVTVEPTSLANQADLAECEGYLTQAVPTDPELPSIAKDDTADLTLQDAVLFDIDAPIKCQGMTWETTWTVAFQAARPE